MIDKSFRRLVGLPCWDVRWDPQTNLSLNFGEPHLVVREPKSTRTRSAKVRLLFSHRGVVVRGAWWLWVWCARWRLTVRGVQPVTGSASRRAIEIATRLLNGQRLERVTIDPRNSMTDFVFDLGARLTVRRLSAQDDADMWILYEPDGRALGVRGDAHFTHEKATRPSRWLPLV